MAVKFSLSPTRETLLGEFSAEIQVPLSTTAGFFKMNFPFARVLLTIHQLGANPFSYLPLICFQHAWVGTGSWGTGSRGHRGWFLSLGGSSCPNPALGAKQPGKTQGRMREMGTAHAWVVPAPWAVAGIKIGQKSSVGSIRSPTDGSGRCLMQGGMVERGCWAGHRRVNSQIHQGVPAPRSGSSIKTRCPLVGVPQGPRLRAWMDASSSKRFWMLPKAFPAFQMFLP